ncbi:MAG: competence/damage-inducible protein A [Verrucomicrobiales bacterium]|nr:competence/damage-inducible protein A [Verrucomicrobiales bacterium]
MYTELINTGSELMLGRVLNTHQQWICRRMADHGYTVTRQVAVSDEAHAIQGAVREALERADLILTTGGLGPTSDDLTRDLIAQLLGRPLREDPAALANIESFFTSRKRPMPASTRVQAMVPEGAQVLPNGHGTAPGLAIPLEPRPGSRLPRWLIMLPGPPRELHPMFLNQALPLIQKAYPLGEEYVCRTLKTAGLGESWVEEKVSLPLKPWTDSGMDLGYCARTGEVDVRFVCRGPDAKTRVNGAEKLCRELLGGYVFGVDDETLEGVLVRLLTERKRTVGLAESCTGGFVSHRLTNVPGASEVFRGSIVSYHNEIKHSALGVSSEILREHGAVSEPCARLMAEGARRALGVDYALSMTGIAGPGGGTPEKPVGTVFIGLASATGTTVVKNLNRFDRETFKFVTSQQALNLLRHTILGTE